MSDVMYFAAAGCRRILRHGLAVTELAENPLPGVPRAVFAFKEVGASFPLHCKISEQSASLSPSVQRIALSNTKQDRSTSNVRRRRRVRDLDSLPNRYVHILRRATLWFLDNTKWGSICHLLFQSGAEQSVARDGT